MGTIKAFEENITEVTFGAFDLVDNSQQTKLLRGSGMYAPVAGDIAYDADGIEAGVERDDQTGTAKEREFTKRLMTNALITELNNYIIEQLDDIDSQIAFYRDRNKFLDQRKIELEEERGEIEVRQRAAEELPDEVSRRDILEQEIQELENQLSTNPELRRLRPDLQEELFDKRGELAGLSDSIQDKMITLGISDATPETIETIKQGIQAELDAVNAQLSAIDIEKEGNSAIVDGLTQKRGALVSYQEQLQDEGFLKEIANGEHTVDSVFQTLGNDFTSGSYDFLAKNADQILDRIGDTLSFETIAKAGDSIYDNTIGRISNFFSSSADPEIAQIAQASNSPNSSAPIHHPMMA